MDKRRIAIEVPLPIHERAREYCEARGLSMTQWAIMLIVQALEQEK